MPNLLVRILLGLFAVFSLAACDAKSQIPADLPPETIILNYAWTGGCAWGGRCSYLLVYADGRFEYRPSPSKTEDEVLATGQLPESAVSAWLDEARKTDFKRLKSSLGPGSCHSCADGNDEYITVLPKNSPENGQESISSLDFAFDTSKPFFQQTFTLLALTEDLKETIEPPVIPVVLSYQTSGACEPDLVGYCPKVKLYADGRCHLIRPYETGDQIVLHKQLSEEGMSAWKKLAANTDFEALKASLPEGREGYPFKGSDRRGPDISIAFLAGEETVSLNSADTSFDHTLAIFKSLRAVTECYPPDTKLRQDAFWLSEY